MIAHILIGTFTALLTAIASAILGSSFLEIVGLYLIGGFAGMVLSVFAQVFRRAPRTATGVAHAA